MSTKEKHPRPIDETAETQDGGGTAQQTGQGPAPIESTEPQEVAETESSAREIEELRAQIAEKDAQLNEIRDKYLRALAESENTRKRMRQQSEETIRIQRENVLRDLLPIVDNLERALDAARGGGNGKSIVEGVEMVFKSMLDFLRAQGVTPLEALGQPFDPRWHEAIDHVASDKHAPNTVIKELHRGYQIGERVLRPASVTVAKEPARPETRRNGGEDEKPDIENA